MNKSKILILVFEAAAMLGHLFGIKKRKRKDTLQDSLKNYEDAGFRK